MLFLYHTYSFSSVKHIIQLWFLLLWYWDPKPSLYCRYLILYHKTTLLLKEYKDFSWIFSEISMAHINLNLNWQSQYLSIDWAISVFCTLLEMVHICPRYIGLMLHETSKKRYCKYFSKSYEGQSLHPYSSNYRSRDLTWG